AFAYTRRLDTTKSMRLTNSAGGAAKRSIAQRRDSKLTRERWSVADYFAAVRVVGALRTAVRAPLRGITEVGTWLRNSTRFRYLRNSFWYAAEPERKPWATSTFDVRSVVAGRTLYTLVNSSVLVIDTIGSRLPVSRTSCSPTTRSCACFITPSPVTSGCSLVTRSEPPDLVVIV